MTNFDDFWNKNGDAYIEHAKTVAKADFKALTSGKFVSHIDIETDDDFSLEGGTSFSIYANTKKEAVKKTIAFLNDIKFDNIPNWAKKPDGSLEERYISKWNWVKEEAIKQLEKGETYISFGGNQTIEINVRENKPALSVKLK